MPLLRTGINILLKFACSVAVEPKARSLAFPSVAAPLAVVTTAVVVMVAAEVALLVVAKIPGTVNCCLPFTYDLWLSDCIWDLMVLTPIVQSLKTILHVARSFSRFPINRLQPRPKFFLFQPLVLEFSFPHFSDFWISA